MWQACCRAHTWATWRETGVRGLFLENEAAGMKAREYKCEICKHVVEISDQQPVNGILMLCTTCKKKTLHIRVYRSNIIIPKSFKAV